MVEICNGLDLLRFGAACFCFGIVFSMCMHGIFGK